MHECCYMRCLQSGMPQQDAADAIRETPSARTLTSLTGVMLSCFPYRKDDDALTNVLEPKGLKNVQMTLRGPMDAIEVSTYDGT